MSRLLTGCGRLGFETVGTETSAASIDAVPFDVCAATPVADTVALYTFEGSAVTDATGAHSGTKVGDVDQAAGGRGTDAIGFPAGTPTPIRNPARSGRSPTATSIRSTSTTAHDFGAE